MATKRRVQLDRKCKGKKRIIIGSTEDEIIEISKEEYEVIESKKKQNVLREAVGIKKKGDNSGAVVEFDKNVSDDRLNCSSATDIKDENDLSSDVFEQSVSENRPNHSDATSINEEEDNLEQEAIEINENVLSEVSDEGPSANQPDASNVTSASEHAVIPTVEQRLRSELPVSVVEYANKLAPWDLKDFTCQIRDEIWNHFYDENSTFEQITSNRPIPGFEARSQQVRQARGALLRVFNQIRTPAQISLFVRDYSSVLKFNSLERFNNRLRSLISEHQRRERPSLVNRFCFIQ